MNFFKKMWTIFKVVIEFVTVLLLRYVLVLWLQGKWDFSSPTRVEPPPPVLEGEVLTNGPLWTFPVAHSWLLLFYYCFLSAAIDNLYLLFFNLNFSFTLEHSWWLGFPGEEQGNPACCRSWGQKGSDTAQRLNHNRWHWWERICLPMQETQRHGFDPGWEKCPGAGNGSPL